MSLQGVLKVVVVAVSLTYCSSTAQAMASQQTLPQYVSELQKSPDDAPSEKITMFAMEMKPAPETTEETNKPSPNATAGQEQKKADEFFKSLNGVRYVRPFQDFCSKWTISCDIHGDEIDVGATLNWQSDPECNPNETVGMLYLRSRCRVINKKMQGNDFVFEFDNSYNNRMYKSVTISGDGNTLTLYFNNNSTKPEDYQRER